MDIFGDNSWLWNIYIGIFVGRLCLFYMKRKRIYILFLFMIFLLLIFCSKLPIIKKNNVFNIQRVYILGIINIPEKVHEDRHLQNAQKHITKIFCINLLDFLKWTKFYHKPNQKYWLFNEPNKGMWIQGYYRNVICVIFLLRRSPWSDKHNLVSCRIYFLYINTP